MPAGNLIRIDIYQFLEMQRRERYRAFVVHASPLEGKTRFAQGLSRTRKGYVYFDVLSHIVSRPELATCIDRFDAKALFNVVLVHAATTEATVLLVDEIDFLMHMWDDDLMDFKRMIEWLSCTQTPTTIGFFLQSRPALEEWVLPNTAGQNRILLLDGILPLPPISTEMSLENEEVL